MTDKDFDVYLASASPRRQALLAQIGVTFWQVVCDVPEVPLPGESPQNFVTRMAVEKAQAGQAKLAAESAKPVLGADTAVVVDNTILGKPRDREHGLAMLQQLSGRTHEVISGVAIVTDRVQSRLNISRVSFRPISQAEREAYWQTGEPADKAGAYGIQGKAAIFIDRLEGSYSAVMGLPLFETAGLLQAAGIRLLR